MTKSSALIATAFASLLLATTVPAQTSDADPPSAGVSKVRIVRLSEASAHVQMDRNTGRGFEPAMANLPVVEKSQLETGQGVAEVEFEDNSTLRLAPESVVEFPQLDRLASGATVSSVHLLKGMAYVSLVKSKTPNEFNLLFGDQKVALLPGSHVRLQLDGVEARLAVLDGNVRVGEQVAALDVPKKKTVTFDLLDHKQPTVAKDILPEATDSWDQNSSGYHARAASFGAFGNSPYAYGTNDMMYYGSFANMGGGCGSMWRPYFASANWDPYSNGAWAYYQGAGYSWVSPYPWGWTPYHYGSWSYCGNAGWGWQPGGMWNGLNNTGTMMAFKGRNPMPPTPIHPPLRGAPTMTLVNNKPLVRSEIGSGGTFVFRKDSAGIGVPRDGLGKLSGFSNHAVQRGTASTPVYLSVPTSNVQAGRTSQAGRSTGMGAAPVAVHRGSPPSSGGSYSSAGSSGGFSGRGNSGGSGGSPSASSGMSSAGHSSGGSAPSGGRAH